MEIGNRGSRMKDGNFGNGRQNMRNGKRNGYAWFRMLCITAGIMLLLLCAAASFAEGTIVFEGDETVTRVSGEANGLSNDAAAEGYIRKLFSEKKKGASGLVGKGTLAGAQLTGKEKILYDKLKDQILRVARGEISSTVFEVPVRDLYEDVTYTAAQLGVSSITSETQEEAMTRFYALLKHPDTDKVLNALLADLPYDLYWYDKLTGCEYGYPSYSYNVNEMSIGNYDSGVIRYSFTVAGAYRDQNVSGNEYLIDQGFGQNAVQAAENAESIISDYAALGDYAKLTAYKNWICNHVDYNDDAAKEENNTPYGDPWQMVWVFDGNDQTKVVCEGYSKAFQYLCDESEFTGNVTSILATGMMGGGTGAGAHMWNLVQTETDGPWYLVDVTNSDEGSAGEAGGLFMDGYDSQDNAWYLYNTVGGGQVAYSFDEEIAGLYGNDYPALSGTAFEVGEEDLVPCFRVPESIGMNEGLAIELLLSAENVGYVQAELEDPNTVGIVKTTDSPLDSSPAVSQWTEVLRFTADDIAEYAQATGINNSVHVRMKAYSGVENGQAIGEPLVSMEFDVARDENGTVTESSVTLYVNGSSEAAVTAQAQQKIYVTVAAEGEKPSQIWFQNEGNGNGEIIEAEDLESKDGVHTGRIDVFYLESGEYPLWAVAYYGESPTEGEEWERTAESNTVFLQVNSAGSATAPTITLGSDTVKRGEPLEVTIGEGANVSEYRVEILQETENEAGIAHTYITTLIVRRPGTLWLDTLNLEPGDYGIQVDCKGTLNYDSSTTELIPFTVTENPDAEGEFVFTVSQRECVPRDVLNIAMYYPGAFSYRFFREVSGEEYYTDFDSYDSGYSVDSTLTVEAGLTRVWAEARTEDGEVLATSDIIEITVTELQPYSISLVSQVDAEHPEGSHTIAATGLDQADDEWHADLYVMSEPDEYDNTEWEFILSWGSWLGDDPAGLVIPAGTLETGKQYYIHAEAARYGSDTAVAELEFSTASDSPVISVESNQVLFQDYARFSVMDPDIEEVRYRTESAGWYNTINRWDIHKTGESAGWSIYQNEEGEKTYLFQVKKDGNWSGWSDPVTVTCYTLGTLDQPTMTVPATLPAGEPFYVCIDEVEDAESYRVYWRGTDGTIGSWSMPFDSFGVIQVNGFGLDAGTYEVYVEVSTPHYQSSESERATLTVTGERPAAPVPVKTELKGYFGDPIMIGFKAPGADAVTMCNRYHLQPNDCYLVQNGIAEVPGTVAGWDQKLTVRSRVDGRWSGLSAPVTVKSLSREEDGIRIDVTIPENCIHQGQDAHITFRKLSGAGFYTYNVSYADPASEDPEDPIMVNIVYETVFDPEFVGDMGYLTIPAYYFRYVGDYQVTVNAYRDDEAQSFLGAGTKPLMVLENSEQMPAAPTVIMTQTSYPLHATVTAQVLTGGADRLVVFRMPDYGWDYSSFEVETIDLEEGQESFTYTWFAETSGKFRLVFSVYRDGVLSPESDPILFTVEGTNERVGDMKLMAPASIRKGDNLTVSWSGADGAEWYMLGISGLDEDEIFRLDHIDGELKTLTIPWNQIPETDSGWLDVWMQGMAEGKNSSWAEAIVTLEDPAWKPKASFLSATENTWTLRVSGITGDRLAVAIDGTEAGYVAVSGTSATVTVPATANTQYVQFANRGTKGYRWSTFSEKTYQLHTNTLKLPADLTEIGSGAFAGLGTQVTVIIPGTVTEIADDAFDVNTVLLVVEDGSYAQNWAIAHGYRYNVQ